VTEARDPLRAYYAARAAEYYRIYLKPERQADLRQIEAWLPAHFAGRRVLEVACGTGYWTRLIAPVATHMLALDAAPETLEIARRRMPEERVLFKVGDAYALHECIKPGQRFDAAFAGFWWSHVPRPRLREFLQGLHACLEPDARVVFLDNRFVPGSSTPVSEEDAQGDTWQQRRLEDGSTHRVLKNFPTEAALREAVAGLANDVRITTWEHYWALEYLVLTPQPAGSTAAKQAG
jgi:demethylmenaquinone methyltransferase/2-methoxy-6-polyprenyl-1,4-benzoquinol methylase